MIRRRLFRSTGLVPSLGALALALGLVRASSSAQALPPPLIFGRVPHGESTIAAGRSPNGARCSTDAALVGGPAVHAESAPAARVTSSVGGSIAIPLCAFDRLVVTAVGDVQPGLSPLQVNGYFAGAAIALPLRSANAWISYRTAATPLRTSSAVAPDGAAATSDSGLGESLVTTMTRAPMAEFSIGAARRVGPLSLEISAAAARGMVREEGTTAGRMVTDSILTDTLGWIPYSHEVGGSRITRAVGAHWLSGALYASWTHSRFSAGASVGGRLSGARLPGAAFGSLELSARMLPNVWLVGATGAGPDFARSAAARGAYSMLGLRFTYAAHTGFVTSVPDVAGALTVAPIDSATYLFSLRAPDARRVEMSGEFTHWRPVALTRSAEGLWVVRLRVTPGAYRANVRIDGGRWQAPPGTTPVEDDFGGAAGVVVVPSR